MYEHLCQPLQLNPQRLRLARKRKHMTQGGLAEAVGLTQGYISLAESGGRNVSLEAALALAAVLEVTIGFLCGEAQSPDAPAAAVTPGPREQILADREAPPGLVALARDTVLGEALQISDAQWSALRSLRFGHGLTKDGYVTLLGLLRCSAFAPAEATA